MVKALFQPSENLLGTLQLLILKTLSHGPKHGFGITLHIQTASEGLLRVEEGSLYPALHRLERAKLIGGKWVITENGRRARVYSLIAAGRKRACPERTLCELYRMHPEQQSEWCPCTDS